MTQWPDKVFVFEVNTWVWLNTLSRKYNRIVTLADVPDEDVDDLARPNVDIIWLMGVWERSPFGRQHAIKVQHEYRSVLPDLRDEDIIGSAYAIYRYEVAEALGGREGLARFRERLRERGLQLILDFVPNHVAVDHPWTVVRPDFIVQGTVDDLKNRPTDFFLAQDNGNKTVLAHGRDPYFPGWIDTAQLNAFNPELRDAVVELLRDIASQCDGVRCDMAMLVMNAIFAGTWHGYVGAPPAEDFWPYVIPKVRALYPEFQFIAEAYWGKEYDVLQQGFDFAYDKVLYDRIVDGDVAGLRAHLVAELGYQQKLIRFIENHDEPRAYTALGREKSSPAATLICTLPGACLLHQGQFYGARAKLPVQIGRQPIEQCDEELYYYYFRLLEETRAPIYQHGQWYLFEMRPAGQTDGTHHNLLAYGWREAERDYRLMVVNLTPIHSYARLPLTFWNELAGKRWTLYDVLDGNRYDRDGDEMTGQGLFIDLAPYESHIFRFERAG